MNKILIVILLLTLSACSRTEYEQVKCVITGVETHWSESITWLRTEDGRVLRKEGLLGEVGDEIVLKLEKED